MNSKYISLKRTQIEGIISYNPLCGTFVRKSRAQEYKLSFECFTETQPKIFLQIDNVQYRIPANKVAWLLHYGDWCENPILHRNTDRFDFRISNLLSVPKKSHYVVLNHLKNLDDYLKLQEHPTDQHKLIVQFIEDKRLRTKYFDGAIEAQKFIKEKRKEIKDKLIELGCTI